VQVVTGFGDGLSETEKKTVQSHAASKSFESLSQQGQMLHETLVKLGAYMIGEFGHFLPNNITPSAKFSVLRRHFSAATQQSKSILLLATVKMLNANPEALKSEVVAFLTELQESQEVELQQRSCELLLLIRDDELLDHVLCPMPAYAEAVQANNPLIQRLKFQSNSRAVTRAQLEEAAKSEGGIFKPGANVAKGIGNRSDSVSDAVEESNQLPTHVPAPPNLVSENNGVSDSDSGSDSDDGAKGGLQFADGGTASPLGQNPKDLWQQLCIMPQGRFYSSNSLVLELKHEYMADVGRITIMFINNSQAPIGNIRVTMPEAPQWRLQGVNEPPTQLGPGMRAPHYVQAQCLQPFLQPARYLVEYSEGRPGPPTQVPLMLPAVLTKYMSPAEVQIQQFRQYFEGLAGPPRESVIVGQAKVPPNQWPNYLTKGFNLHLLSESNPTGAFAAGTLHTATPDPSQPGKNMTVPVMLHLEYNTDRNMVRITVRSPHGEVTNPLSKIVETYLVVPVQPNGVS